MARKKSTVPEGADLEQDERLGMAASYLERAMQQVVICAAALNSKEGIDQHLVVEGVTRTLQEDVHNDLNVAREIFRTWKAADVAHG